MTDSINILSYNVSWEAMISDGIKRGSVDGSNKCNTVNNCRENVKKLIEKAINNQNVSIIGTQETGLLFNELKKLRLSNIPVYLRNATDIGGVISFNDNLINLTDHYFNNLNNLNLTGYQKNAFDLDERVHQIVILEHFQTSNRILFINLHHPHHTSIQKTFNTIEQNMEKNKINDNYKRINKIIITGDFNTNIIDNSKQNISYQNDSGFTLLGKKLSVYTLLNTTCCDGDLNGTYWEGDRRDNILTYGFDEGNVIQLIEPKDHVLHSDHLPVILSLPLKKEDPYKIIDDKILKLGIKVNKMNKTEIFEDIFKDKDEIIKLIEN
jgi:hypothetical protein